ncbi:GAF domain-like protein [Polychytrium aggregatum]|uniref:GAF domain-like protein n=1 Tax=Polychytrium aggregatum TaxID=110093 RepID=UPI0022FE5E34|nr:GAF domain-like protein [Polychytrium aggregatum]KAI9209283.1 GAF domain-like protein [Polychytrium aggregatum]
MANRPDRNSRPSPSPADRTRSRTELCPPHHRPIDATFPPTPSCLLAMLILPSVASGTKAEFYASLSHPQTLVLGPFQGRIACTVIPFAKGVCGAAASRRETVVVKDVHEFPGHIACDSASQSEIVVPLVAPSNESEIVGVLDIDASEKNVFDEEDKAGFELLVAVLMQKCKF